MGYNLRDDAGADISGDNAFQNMVKDEASQFRTLLESMSNRPIVVASAGNEAVATPQWANEWCYLALVEQAGDCASNGSKLQPLEGCQRWGSTPPSGSSVSTSGSNIGGTHSAPGGRIYSALNNGLFGFMSGTSMAAPRMTGEIAFLLSVEPSLSDNDIHRIVNFGASSNDPPVLKPSAGARYVSLFDAMLAIDFIKGNKNVVRRLCDVDDGTPDGNQRVDAAGEVVHDDAHGDGKVDMRDFRRWRDWLLQLEGAAHLDGPAAHAKRDLNGSGGLPDGDEDLWPVGDFNGSAELERLATRHIHPNSPMFSATDIDVLETVFEDERSRQRNLEGLHRLRPTCTSARSTASTTPRSCASRRQSRSAGAASSSLARAVGRRRRTGADDPRAGRRQRSDHRRHNRGLRGRRLVVGGQTIRGSVHRGEDVYTGGCYQDADLDDEVLRAGDAPTLTSPECPRETKLAVVLLGGGAPRGSHLNRARWRGAAWHRGPTRRTAWRARGACRHRPTRLGHRRARTLLRRVLPGRGP